MMIISIIEYAYCCYCCDVTLFFAKIIRLLALNRCSKCFKNQ